MKPLNAALSCIVSSDGASLDENLAAVVVVEWPVEKQLGVGEQNQADLYWDHLLADYNLQSAPMDSLERPNQWLIALVFEHMTESTGRDFHENHCSED